METFGIELEVSDLAISRGQDLLNQAGLNWRVKMDGTHHVSAEAVSPILTRDRLNEARTATRALRIGGATVNRQCGLHVHLGASEYGTEGIANLVWNWNLAHRTIGALVAKSRLNNRFCVPVALSELDAQVEHVRNGNISNIGLNGRYRSLNLNAYATHGTVEVRLHHGTLNGAKVKAWAEFVSALARYSSAGSLLQSHDGWQNTTEPENKIKELLDILALVGTLSTDTAEYLKGRADELAR
jgi:hypothetical protein